MIAEYSELGWQFNRKAMKYKDASLSDNQLNQIVQKHMDFSYTDSNRRESELRRNYRKLQSYNTEQQVPSKRTCPTVEFPEVFERTTGQGVSQKDTNDKASWLLEEAPSYQSLSSQLKQVHPPNLPKRNHCNISSIKDFLNPDSSGGISPCNDTFGSAWQLPKLRIPPEQGPSRSPYAISRLYSLKGVPPGHCTTRDYPDPYRKASDNLTARHDYSQLVNTKKDPQRLVPTPKQQPREALKETASTLATITPLKTETKPTVFKSRRTGNTLTLADFDILKQIGSGKFSNVMMARHKKTGFLCALKEMKKERIDKQKLHGQILREIKISSYTYHPNIIATYGFFDDEENLYLVEELASDGQLYKLLQKKERFSEEATSFIIRQVLEAVAYLHKNRIYHRDIKPENIVLSHGNVKLCDLGWSVYTGKNELRRTMCGTPLYASPEQLQGHSYSDKIDLWAIGILAYELYFGNIPFDINVQEELVRIITDDVVFPQGSEASPEFQDFIQSILKKNPCERLNCQELLRHPFIEKYRDFQTCEELCSF